MTIVQKPSPINLSGNLPSFIMFSDDPFNFVIKKGNISLLSGSYTPGGDRKVTIDVKDVIEFSLSFQFRDILETYTQDTLIGTFYAYINDELICNFEVIKGGISNFGMTPQTFLQQHFLTWQPREKRVSYSSPEYLTYYAVTDCRIKLKAYMSTVDAIEMVISELQQGKVYTIPVMYAVVAGKLNAYPAYYDIWVESADGSVRYSYIQRFVYEQGKSEQEEYIIFENSLGGVDCFRAYGNTVFNADNTHNIAIIDDQLNEYRIDTEYKYTKNTGYLTKYEAEWLKDFFPSTGKYIFRNNILRKIVLTEDNVSSSEQESVNSYEFTYRYADDNIYLNLPVYQNSKKLISPMSLNVDNVEKSLGLEPRLAEFPMQKLSEGSLIPVQEPFSERWNATNAGAIANYIIEKINSLTDGRLLDNRFKGYYLTETSLKESYPNPLKGDSAWVGEPFPGVVYTVENGKWKTSGKAPDFGDINLEDYATKEDLAAQDSKLTELSSGMIRSTAVNKNTNIAFSQFSFFKFGYVSQNGSFQDGSASWGTEWNTVFVPVKVGVTYKIKSGKVGSSTKFWACNDDLVGIHSIDYEADVEFSYTAQDGDAYIAILYSPNMYIIANTDYNLEVSQIKVIKSINNGLLTLNKYLSDGTTTYILGDGISLAQEGQTVGTKRSYTRLIRVGVGLTISNLYAVSNSQGIYLWFYDGNLNVIGSLQTSVDTYNDVVLTEENIPEGAVYCRGNCSNDRLPNISDTGAIVYEDFYMLKGISESNRKTEESYNAVFSKDIYSSSDMEKDKYYDGSSDVMPSSSYSFSPTENMALETIKIPVKQGSTIIVKSYGATNGRAYALTDLSRNIYKKADASADCRDGITIVAEKDGFLYVTNNYVRYNSCSVQIMIDNINSNSRNIENLITTKDTSETLLYGISDFDKDIAYSSSNNSIGETVESKELSGYYSKKVEIGAYKTIIIKSVGAATYRRWIFVDENDRILSIAPAEGASGVTVEDLELQKPNGAKSLIVQVSVYNANGNGLSLGDVKISLSYYYKGLVELTEEVNNIPTTDTLGFGEYFHLDKGIIRLNTAPSMASIIHSWGFIGGSTSSGAFEYTEEGTTKFVDEYDYSIGQRFCKINGVEGYNFSQGGQYARAWCQGSGDRTWGGAQKIENLKHAYVVDLGANDLKYYEAGNLETDVDFDNYENNADTFAGWIVGLVQRLRSVNPRCYIFFLTSRNYMYSDNSDYTKKAAPIVRQLPEFLKGHFEYDRFYLIDHNKYGQQYGSEYRPSLMNGGHPSVIGYQHEAFVMNTLIDAVIRENLDDFKEAMFVLNGRHRE